MAQTDLTPADMAKPIPTLIDNRPGNSMLDAIRRLMHEARELDIATGYFEVGAMVDLDSHWQTVQAIRILMGDETSRPTRVFLVNALRSRQNGIEDAKKRNDWLALEHLQAIETAIVSGHIAVRIYTKDKFHAKAYHFKTGSISNRGIIGSSNFTRPGLTRNLELNLFTSDNSQLSELGKWYEAAWSEAEDIRDDLIQVIQPHIREYHPFEIYLQAMRERFFGLEPEETTWEKSESKLYPLLAQYQRDAYHDLMHMADTWGGGMLCDGVGLGKTFVALMLIERARRNREKVLVIAPKAAIPSVWERNLNQFFPDDFGRFTDDIRVMPMTDFGAEGTIKDEDIQRLRKRYDTIIVDEAHHFRVPSRNRSKKLKELTRGKRLFMLTATPVNNSLLDLYVLLNYIAQDDQRKFQSVNVPHLRNWFSEQTSERQDLQHVIDDFERPDFQEFLRHVLVARSRQYVKGLDRQMDANVKFPTRERPIVVDYSLTDTYGALFPKLVDAFETRQGKLKLVIYETERFKEQSHQDTSALQEQSQVVALVRTMLLKRLESSQKALEASIEDLLLKHITLLKSLHTIKYETWYAENADLYEVLSDHRKERMRDQGDEEEEDIPLTTYENKKIERVKADIQEFGVNEAKWLEGLEGDIRILSELLRGLHQVTNPENDAKLQAFLGQIESDTRLRTSKFVLFSEFKDTARYLETELKKRFPNDAIVEVDSGRNVNNRADVIERFAPHYNCPDDRSLQKALANPIRILVSTDVLSEGLNLQDANVIVNYDLHWNPVRLMQRIGRVDRRMDPTKPVDYDKVYVYNFLPPNDLERVLGLFQSITGKLIAINRALGIEAPVLTADDDFKAMDFYLNLGEGTLSVEESLRLKAHDLARQHPELWARTQDYPNRIYSGKAEKGGGKHLFLCYRIVTGYDPENPEAEPTRDAKWIMIDRDTGAITEDLEAMHAAIACAEGTPRKATTTYEERTKLRKKVENEVIDVIRYRSQIPADYQDELVCWMEVG